MWWACWGSGTGLRPQAFVSSLCHYLPLFATPEVWSETAHLRAGVRGYFQCYVKVNAAWFGCSVSRPRIYIIFIRKFLGLLLMKLISDLCIRHFGLLKLRDVAASGITGSAGLGEHADEVISKLRVPQAFTVSQSQSILFAFVESRNYRSLSHTRSELLLEDQPYLKKNLKEYLDRSAFKIRKGTPGIDMKDKKFLEGQNFYFLFMSFPSFKQMLTWVLPERSNTWFSFTCLPLLRSKALKKPKWVKKHFLKMKQLKAWPSVVPPFSRRFQVSARSEVDPTSLKPCPQAKLWFSTQRVHNARSLRP